MDAQYELRGQTFEWDLEKAAGQSPKARRFLRGGLRGFLRPFLVLVDAGGEGESREAAIGLTEDWSLLVVVHIVRQAGALRIISARQATPAERRNYEDG
jgi:uncharacterized DUF497 family protein